MDQFRNVCIEYHHPLKTSQGLVRAKSNGDSVLSLPLSCRHLMLFIPRPCCCSSLALCSLFTGKSHCVQRNLIPNKTAKTFSGPYPPRCSPSVGVGPASMAVSGLDKHTISLLHHFSAILPSLPSPSTGNALAMRRAQTTSPNARLRSLRK